VTRCGIPPQQLPNLDLAFIDALLETQNELDRDRESLNDHRLAQILCLIANAHRDPKSRPFELRDFLPRQEHDNARPEPGVDDLITTLGAMFPTKKKAPEPDAN